MGVGVRLAENRRAERFPDRLVSRERLSPFLARLDALEKKIASYAPPDDGNTETVEVDRTSSIHEITEQIAAMEKRLRQDLEQRQGERLDQMSDALEKRLAQRIAPIEAEMENQRAAVGELRDFSLRTETSLQKLLEGIEKLVVAQQSSRPPDTVVS